MLDLIIDVWWWSVTSRGDFTNGDPDVRTATLWHVIYTRSHCFFYCGDYWQILEMEIQFWTTSGVSCHLVGWSQGVKLADWKPKISKAIWHSLIGNCQIWRWILRNDFQMGHGRSLFLSFHLKSYNHKSYHKNSFYRKSSFLAIKVTGWGSYLL